MKIWDKIFKSKAQETRDFLPTAYSTYSPITFKCDDDPIVKACVDKLTNALAVCPLKLYSHTKGGKVQAISHPLFHVLENPCVEETATLFYSSMIRQLLYTGNSFVYLCRDSKGTIVAFKLVDSRRCRVERTADFHKIFIIDGQTYGERDILHIPYIGEGYNGTIGISPINLHSDLINLHQQLLLYISNYFNNSLGSRLSIEFGESWGVKPQDIERMYSSVVPIITKFVQGSANAGKPMINLPDSKLTSINQTSNAEAQLSSLIKFVEKEICNIFSIPYELIDSEGSKYNSIEQKNLSFLQESILPLGNHICQSFQKLLSPTDNNLFIEYSYSSMLTSDFKTTCDYLKSEVQSGLLSINEARKKLGESSIDPAVGDILWMPSNLIPATKENVEAILAKSKLALEESNSKEEDHNILGDDKN